MTLFSKVSSPEVYDELMQRFCFDAEQNADVIYVADATVFMQGHDGGFYRVDYTRRRNPSRLADSLEPTQGSEDYQNTLDEVLLEFGLEDKTPADLRAEIETQPHDIHPDATYGQVYVLKPTPCPAVRVETAMEIGGVSLKCGDLLVQDKDNWIRVEAFVDTINYGETTMRVNAAGEILTLPADAHTEYSRLDTLVSTTKNGRDLQAHLRDAHLMQLLTERAERSINKANGIINKESDGPSL